MIDARRFLICLLVPLFLAATPYLPHRRKAFRTEAAVGGSTIPPGIAANQSTKSDIGNATTLTWSHTVPSGDNRCLVVMIGMGDAGGEIVTGITFNGGGTFTQVAYTNDANFMTCEMWCMTNPPVTTANIVITFSGLNQIEGAAGINLTNVQQVTSPFTAIKQNRGTDQSPTVTISSSSLQLPLAVMATDQQGTMSVTAGTELWEFESLDSDVNAGGATVTGSGSSTMTWSTQNIENSWVVVGASFLAP